MDLTLNRHVTYLGVVYRVIEELTSGHLLVVAKEDFEKGEYPMNTLIIPFM